MTASAATRPARSGRDRGPHPEQAPGGVRAQTNRQLRRPLGAPASLRIPETGVRVGWGGEQRGGVEGVSTPRFFGILCYRESRGSHHFSWVVERDGKRDFRSQGPCCGTDFRAADAAEVTRSKAFFIPHLLTSELQPLWKDPRRWMGAGGRGEQTPTP